MDVCDETHIIHSCYPAGWEKYSGGGVSELTERLGVCHFGSRSGTQKFNFRIKIPPKNLFYKSMLAVSARKTVTLLIYQEKMASSLLQVAKIS